jgi:hypothetical protein
MNIDRNRLRESTLAGLRKGWKSFIWVLEILIPISLLTALLLWSGWISKIDFLFQSLMGWIHLPALAALPLLIGIIAGFYGGIAAMSALPFSLEEITLMAIFMMICHSLIQEGIIQGKSGWHPLKAALFRLGVAIITVLVVSLFFDSASAPSPVTRNPTIPSPPLEGYLQNWVSSTLYLTGKIFIIIVGVHVLLEIIKAMGWIDPLIKLLSPVLKFLGLSEKAGTLWIAGAFFGLIYGAAVILEEMKEGLLTDEEAEKLHLSIGINHSFIEDPILFMALGVSFFWAWVPRLLAAILSVHLLNLWQKHLRKFFPIR